MDILLNSHDSLTDLQQKQAFKCTGFGGALIISITLRPRINEGSFEKQGVGKLSKYNKWRSWNKRGRFLFISTLMTWMYRNWLMYRQVCNLWKETKVLKQCKSNTFVFKWFSVIYTFYLHYFTFLRTAFKTLSNIDSTTKWLFTLYQKF